ncbi:MAG: hypothetical protein K8H88_01885 [Sandaracinaceae bacterium]|nr:hypothetical protein [Sandaracinaceae bacterium]
MRVSLVLSVLTVLALSVSLGCTAGRPAPRDGAVGGDGGGQMIPGCDPSRDADGDGVPDQAEGTTDPDMDGLPSHMDPDADGDGILDRDEARGAMPCYTADADGDGIPNWLDTDSDNDGLSDAEESGTYFTDPYAIDSDGDTVTDLGEVRGSMTNPLDRTSTIPPSDFFVVLPYLDPAQSRMLNFGTDIQLADVYFLIDTTGSMQEAIDNVTSSLSSLATQVRAEIPNVQLGVGQYRDFPFGGLTGYGSPGDAPYTHEQDITDDLSAVQAALGRLGAGGGADTPESATEALYQTATGEGGLWMYGTSSFELPRKRCPARPDEFRQRRGYPCFRPDALPILVLVTDAQFHNGPGNANLYMGITPQAHVFDQATNALGNLGARFIGVAVGSDPRGHEEEVARITRTVDTSGQPLVYDASGGTVSSAIVEGIGTLVGRTPQDVTTRRDNVDGNPDGFDATMFIQSIVPIDGFNGTARGPQPGITYRDLDATSFYDVVPGTTVIFDVTFYNGVRPPAATAQIFRATIVVLGNNVTRLDSRNVYIIVPPNGQTILI